MQKYRCITDVPTGNLLNIYVKAEVNLNYINIFIAINEIIKLFFSINYNTLKFDKCVADCKADFLFDINGARTASYLILISFHFISFHFIFIYNFNKE